MQDDGGSSPGTGGTGAGSGASGTGSGDKDGGGNTAADGGGSKLEDAAVAADAGGESTPSCSGVSCEPYQHCELMQVTCIRAPCPPLPSCLDNESCGGFTGKPCTGSGECQDDPRDSCDPMNGGADCGGLCVCKETTCDAGKKLDPASCECVVDPCAAVRCKAGTHCVSDGKSAECVPVDGMACGNTVCVNGQECCNASCSRCVDPGMACTQEACE